MRDRDRPSGLLPRPALPRGVAGQCRPPGLGLRRAVRTTRAQFARPARSRVRRWRSARPTAYAPTSVPMPIGDRDYAITLGTHAVTRTISTEGRRVLPAGGLELGTHAPTRTTSTSEPPGATRFHAMPPDRHVIGGNAFLGGRAFDWLLDITTRAPDRQDREVACPEAESMAALTEHAGAISARLGAEVWLVEPPGGAAIRFRGRGCREPMRHDPAWRCWPATPTRQGSWRTRAIVHVDFLRRGGVAARWT